MAPTLPLALGPLSPRSGWRSTAPVPWIRALLRGQQVLARVKDDGSFDAQGGRVEIRYKATDPRAYRAGVANLERIAGQEPMADDQVVAGAAVDKEKEKAEKKKALAAAGPAPVPKDAWEIYADGACSGNPGPAGLGIYLKSPAGAEYRAYEFLGDGQTNNIAELTAILRATTLVPPGAAAVVHTDSQYSIGVLTKGWKAKANQALVAEVKTALAGRSSWRLSYVPGHAGVPGNEAADELAREAVTSRKKSLPEIPRS